MKVILLKDTQNLGKAGEIVSVKRGYARNFLIPRSLARKAAGRNVKMLQKKFADLRKKRKKMEFESLKQVIATLKDKKIKLTRKADEKDHLFAEIHPKDIAGKIEEEYRIKVSEKTIRLPEKIKKIGTYTISIGEGKNKTDLNLEMKKEEEK